MLAIEAHRLRKVYGTKVAVEGLTLEVRQGEVFGFLGPNGAGKSTSVKMFLGLAAPSGGSVRVLGERAGNVEARRKMGFLPEHFRFHEWLTGAEFLDLHARLYGLKSAGARGLELLARVGLAEHSGKRLRDYSKGMLQRIGLAQALLNDPEVIFLDEPTSGLDPAGRRLVRDIIREQRDRGATVFLNSHLLSEVEITCDRVAFIKHGRVLETRELGTMAADEITLTARVRNGCSAVAGLEHWARAIRLDGENLSLTVESEDALPAVLRHLVAGGAEVYSFTPEKLSLEDLFMRIVGADGGL
jgi:ABC-2 type transport system ATP-binding protein